jgi:hypothetical protein
MSRNRLIAIFAVLVLLVAAAFTIGSGIAPAPLASNLTPANDYSVRHPELINSRISVEPMDYIQRHPESLNPGHAVDLSDYYARHSGASIALNTGSASDWFQRHPESLKSADSVIDKRFPGKEQDDLATLDLSDYYQRHPESPNRGNAVDLSDYYLRHPDSDK